MNPEPIREPTPTSTLLPHATEAERGLLCSFMLDPKMVGALCAEKRVSLEHFYHPQHQLVFGILASFWMQGKSCDLITLTNAFRDSGTLDDVGGISGLVDIHGYIPTAWMAVNYIEICENKRILRALIRQGGEIQRQAYESAGEEPAEIVMEAVTNLGRIVDHAASTTAPLDPSEIMLQASARAEDRIQKRGLPDNVMRTGLKQIDEAMSGIRAGDFVLISGKEKSGKTSLAFNIMEHVVFEQGKRAIAVSLEMKIPEIADRMIASMGRINLTNILNGWMSEAESTQFCTTSTRIAGGTFQIRDDVFSLPQIIAALRQYKGAHPDLELAVIDYLQLVDGDKVGKDDSREQIIAKTSRTLRRAASELNIGMLLLVQLNEDGQVRESRAPGMDCTAHIRIEPGDEDGQKWARIVYQRNGPSNVGIPLTHLGQFLRFEQSAPREREIKESPVRRKRKQFDD